MGLNGFLFVDYPGLRSGRWSASPLADGKGFRKLDLRVVHDRDMTETARGVIGLPRKGAGRRRSDPRVAGAGQSQSPVIPSCRREGTLGYPGMKGLMCMIGKARSKSSSLGEWNPGYAFRVTGDIPTMGHCPGSRTNLKRLRRYSSIPMKEECR